MSLLEIAVIALGALAATEREPGRIVLAGAGSLTLAALLLQFVGDVERALLLALPIAVAITGVSRLKHHLSGRILTAADMPLLFAGTVPFMVRQYPVATAGTAASGAVLALAATIALQAEGGEQLAPAARAAALAVALFLCATALRFAGGAETFRHGLEDNRGHLSTFFASLFDTASWRPARGLCMVDAGASPLPLLAPIPARTRRPPDIIVIQHESVFDPRLFGLPVERNVAAFLAPATGRSGTLNVDIYGGGSWQSEFSLLTGLSSRSFGPDAYFLQTRGAGRFRHTLPRALSELGYETLLLSSCRRRFLNYDAFYGAVGFDERAFCDDLFAPDAVAAFEATYSDSQFLPAACEHLAGRLSRREAPQFAFLLTNFNHGPHGRPLANAARFAAERAFAAAANADPHYVEYYARLAETAAAWRAARDNLLARFPDRPMLIVHYGDHQPVLTRRLERRLGLPPDATRPFRTFFAVEPLSFEPDPSALCLPAVLDIAFLGTITQQVAGLALDAISATRASLIAECGTAYFLTPSARKRRFHRTLIEQGLVAAAPMRHRAVERPVSSPGGARVQEDRRDPATE